MDNGIRIISSDGNIIEKSFSNSNTHHADLLREYLEEKKLTYSTYLTDSGYEISYYLANILEISVHSENGVYVYFLGNELTDKQYNYFKKNRKKLRRYNTVFCNMEYDSVNFYDGYTCPDCNVFDIMLEKIEEKEIVNTVDIKKERK